MTQTRPRRRKWNTWSTEMNKQYLQYTKGAPENRFYLDNKESRKIPFLDDRGSLTFATKCTNIKNVNGFAMIGNCKYLESNKNEKRDCT